MGVAWPEEFVITYRDGSSEQLLFGDGIHFDRVEDSIPEVGAGFSALVPKRSPAARQERLRFVRYEDVAAIEDLSGHRLWPT